MQTGCIPDAQIAIDPDRPIGISGKRGTTELLDTNAHPVAQLLINAYLLQLIIGVTALLADKFEHTGMTGDNHAETFLSHGLFHQFGQLFLLIGIHFINGLDPQTFQNLSDGNFLGHLIEIATRAGMILVPGHGGGTVFHNNQGDGVIVEEGIDDSRQTGMIKSGIAYKGHHFA